MKRWKVPSIGVLVAAIWLIGVAILALFADYIPFVRSYEQFVYADGRVAANYKLGPGVDAWFGTDGTGKDVFAKCIYGARVTLRIAFVATAVGMLVGGLLGMAAGFYKGWVDKVVSLVTDVLLAFPPLVLAIVIVFRFEEFKERYSFLGWISRTNQVTAVLSILAIAPLARIVRGQTMAISEREYVMAARSVGAKTGRIIFREILPNLIPTMVTVAFTGVAILIVAEGGLAFLGLSVEIPTPTWGRMIADNRQRIDDAWWATLFPSFMLFFTVLAVNVIGDRIARRFDIREAAI
jgi:peptide/nickel transport system permease protein